MKTGLTANELDQKERRNTSIPRRSTLRERLEIEAKRLSVSIHGNQYLVDFGQGSQPRLHTVGKNKECSCGAPCCEAIEAVRQYLQAGGLRAPDPERMPPCPICGSKTYRDRTWDGKYTRTLGWRCEKGSLRHFLEAKAERIKQQLADNPWLIPPAPGYPGVRRDELMTGEECQAANQRLQSGDDPDI
jgi:hypothetical protein